MPHDIRSLFQDRIADLKGWRETIRSRVQLVEEHWCQAKFSCASAAQPQLNVQQGKRNKTFTETETKHLSSSYMSPRTFDTRTGHVYCISNLIATKQEHSARGSAPEFDLFPTETKQPKQNKRGMEKRVSYGVWVFLRLALFHSG